MRMFVASSLLLALQSTIFPVACAFQTFLVTPSSASTSRHNASTTRLYRTINDPLGDPLVPTNHNNILKVKGHVTASAAGAAATSPTGKQELRKKANLKPFERYLEVECWKKSELRGLEPVMQAVAAACKQINRIVQRAQTDDIYGNAVEDGSTNVQGEVQQKLDVLCNTLMMRAFCASSRNIRAVASEEENEPRCCSDVMVSVI